MKYGHLILLAFLCIGSIASGQEQPTQTTLQHARNLHKVITRDVLDGKSLAEPLSDSLQVRLKSLPGASETLKNEKTGRAPTLYNGLKITEAILKFQIIHITINSLPDACEVKYRPLVGGLTEDAGSTNVEIPMEKLSRL